MQAPIGWWEPATWARLREEFPAWLREQIGFWQRQAVRLDAEVAELTGRVERLAPTSRLPKGSGALTAAILHTEDIDGKRFTNRRQVASYTGLCPSDDTPNERRRQGAINKHGDARVRHVLVEAIWRCERRRGRWFRRWGRRWASASIRWSRKGR